ncbi:MAG TPA: hypothetical protein VKD91_04020 [Pyrinomonadaceae bacterium]|nr:hypothetical protein [Pyrinomonadaceae bacterium]
MFRDFRFALRNLNKHPGLSLAVVATLMLGIGISAGVFAFLNAVILRPQLDKDFDSFAQVYTSYTRDPLRPALPGNATLEDFLAFREHARTLHTLAAWNHRRVVGGSHARGDVGTGAEGHHSQSARGAEI